MNICVPIFYAGINMGSFAGFFCNTHCKFDRNVMTKKKIMCLHHISSLFYSKLRN